MSEQAAVDARPQPDCAHYFDTSLAQERSGLARLFASLPLDAQASWVDLRDDQSWWARGVDYLLVGGAKVDFKVEQKNRPNCAAELIKADRPTLRPGWLLTSEAHWIVHYYEKTGEVVCLPTRGYRELVLARVLGGALRDSTSAANFDKKIKSKLHYLSWNALLPKQTALAKIPGAFWCKLPGAEIGDLTETKNGLAVPVEWLPLWLQSSAVEACPMSWDMAKAMAPELYALLKPYDRRKEMNASRYLLG